MAKHSNRSMLMKIFGEAAEILEMNECQELLNGISRIVKGGDFNSKNLEKGHTVTVYWPEDESKVTGTVKKVAAEMSFIEFDDSERFWVPNAWILKAAAPKTEE